MVLHRRCEAKVGDFLEAPRQVSLLYTHGEPCLRGGEGEGLAPETATGVL